MNIEDQTISFYGGTYTGEVFNGAPSGLGAWVHPDGHAYVGKWVNGNFYGHVAVKLSGGATYVGGCKHDQFYTRTAEGIESGPPHNDRHFHGQGTLTEPDGSQNVGEWRFGRPWSGTRWDKDSLVTEKYSEGVRTPKKKSFSTPRFFFIGIPAVLGWIVIAMILLFIVQFGIGGGWD